MPKRRGSRTDVKRVPEELHEAIETQRDTLAKADSLLGCLAIAMEHEPQTASGPYYPDVARIARQLVRQSINGLDSLTLQQLWSSDKVKDEELVDFWYALLPAHQEQSVSRDRLDPTRGR